MKKFSVYLLTVTMLLAAGLTACGKSADSDNQVEDQSAEVIEATESIDDEQEDAAATITDTEETSAEIEDNDVKDEPQSDLTDSDDVMNADADRERKEAFVKALRDFNERFLLPDGTDVSEEVGDTDTISQNSFSVYDIDCDGEVELLISLTTASMAGMVEQVYSYDPVSKTLVKELNAFPAVAYYEEGFSKVYISHNQGMAGSFWPYTIYKYNTEAGAYEVVAFIDAWDGNYYEEDYSGKKFPSEYDKDGDKMIYYTYKDYGSSFDDDTESDPLPIDIDELNAWLSENMGDVKQLDIPIRDTSREAISEYEASDNLTSELD